MNLSKFAVTHKLTIARVPPHTEHRLRLRVSRFFGGMPRESRQADSSSSAHGAYSVVCAGKENTIREDGALGGPSTRIIASAAMKEKNHPRGWFRRGPVNTHYSQFQVRLATQASGTGPAAAALLPLSRGLEPLGVLESKRPRFRNPVGNAGLVLWLRAWVPEAAFFRVIRSRFKLDSAPESRSEPVA